MDFNFVITGLSNELMKISDQQVTKTDTDRVWIVEIADLAGQIQTGGACAH